MDTFVSKATDQRASAPGGVGEEHTDLAVLRAAGGSGVLPLHPGRTHALLQKPGVIDDQNGIPVSEVFHDIVTYVVQNLVGVPLDPVQQPVDAVRTRMAGLLRQRPAVLPLQRRNQPTHVSQRRLTRLLPVEPVHEPLMQSTQFTRPQPDISKAPTHNHTNDRAGQQSRQAPLQY